MHPWVIIQTESLFRDKFIINYRTIKNENSQYVSYTVKLRY